MTQTSRSGEKGTVGIKLLLDLMFFFLFCFVCFLGVCVGGGGWGWILSFPLKAVPLRRETNMFRFE